MQNLGVRAKPRKQFFERTFRHIGYSTSWSWGLFLFTLYMLSAISFLTDAVQTQNFNWLWFLVSGAAFLPPVVIGWCYRFLYLERRKETPRPWLNLLVAGLAGSSRNVSVGLFSMWAHLENAGLWPFRFMGGFLMGISIFVVWASANGARIEYFASLKKLSEIQESLSKTRQEMPQQVSSTNLTLQEKTQNALYPQLEAIKKLLSSVESASAAVERLRFTITEQIRPMMQEIARQQPKPFANRNIRQFRNISSKLPDTFALHENLNVTWSSVIELIGLSMWLFILGSKNGVLDMLILFAIYFAIMCFFKLLVPKHKQFSKKTGIAITTLFALTASLALTWYIYEFLQFSLPEFFMLSGFAVICGIIGPLLLLQVQVRNQKREEIENQIKDDLKSLAKENALFAQRLWVFRKRWLLILHGNVQSSLTAALTRLQTASEIDQVLIELVKQDLLRAELAVASSQNILGNSVINLEEIQDVWRGICDIEIKFTERAKRALARSTDTAFCVNELVKEAVSNAVRHGDASKVTVAVDRLEDDLLHIDVSNNGIKPQKGKGPHGIGSNLLDEICLSWQLVADKQAVHLVADLPVKL